MIPFEHSGEEFPLLFWLVLPFCETHMIFQVYSGSARNFTERFESVYLQADLEQVAFLIY